MRRLLLALAVSLPVILVPAASADDVIAGLDLGDKRFTQEGVLVITVRYLCPEQYLTSRQTGSLGVEQNFPDFTLRAGSHQFGQRMTCDGTWNRLRVHVRDGEKSSGGTRQFTTRLPVNIGAGFFACTPTPTSYEDCVQGQDAETVVVE
jgi:hypothetical protein